MAISWRCQVVWSGGGAHISIGHVLDGYLYVVRLWCLGIYTAFSAFLTPKPFANCKRMTDNLFNVECKTITFEAFVARNKLNI